MQQAAVGSLGAVFEQRYRVDTQLARGGMSTVYRGLDTRLDRPVAIKVMDARYADDRSFVERFEREARSAAKIHHPNVVAVYDQGVHTSPDGEQQVYLVMELLEGGTLRDLLIERGALPVPLACTILAGMLSALAAAHRVGLIHRDVKPENVLLGHPMGTEADTVKVGDFGLVRAAAEAGTTSKDMILGTMAYLSPEQVATGECTARGDVYSAAVVLYEMLTGNPPYQGDTPLSVAYQHVHNDVPAPSALVPDLPPELDELVLRATRREPEQRPADAGAFLAELENLRAKLRIEPVDLPVPGRDTDTDTDADTDADTTERVEPSWPSADRDHGHELGGTNGGDVSAAETTQKIMPVVSPTIVRPVPVGPQAVGPQGTRAMLRPNLDHAAPPPPPPSRPKPKPKPADGAATPGRKRPSWQLILVGVLVLALVGAGTWWFTSGRWTEVPQVTGQQESQALHALADAHLRPRSTRVRNNAKLGTVIRTEPAAGSKALRDDDVVVVISAGRPVVPGIRAGASIAEVEAAIRSAELQPKRGDDSQRVYDPVAPAGTVVKLLPAPGTPVDIGEPVTMILSKGQAPAKVPDVKGKTKEEAYADLQAAGFQPYDAGEASDDDVEDGHVVRTNPPAGTDVAASGDRRVGVYVMTGVKVPNVERKRLDEAKKILEKLGLKVEVHAYLNDSDRARVYQQEPAPGTKVAKGSTVILVTWPF